MVDADQAFEAAQRIHHDLSKLWFIDHALALKIWKDVVILQRRVHELEGESGD